jgi:hypothetical protein
MLQDDVALSTRVDTVRNHSQAGSRRAGQYEDVWRDYQGIFQAKRRNSVCDPS